MDIIVREYQEGDLEYINKILDDAFHCVRPEGSFDGFHEVVAVADERPVGYLILTKVFNPIKNASYYLVDYVCVDSNYRGLGIGKKMMDYAYMIAKNDGAIYLQLTSSRFRVAAHKLYEKCNYMKRESDIFRKEII